MINNRFYGRLFYDATNGKIDLSNNIDNPLYYSKVLDISCFTAIPLNGCVTIVNENANLVNSKYNNNITNLTIPYINGIALSNGDIGTIIPVANIIGNLYKTTQILPGNYQDLLYVGQDGIITNIKPTTTNGDIWLIVVGIKIDDYSFVFEPSIPINLVSSLFPTPVPIVIGDGEKVTLSQAMPQLTCFRIDETGRAFTITANDVNLPMVDGITLESGGINQSINVARLKNYYYDCGVNFTESNIYYLNSMGGIQIIKPTDVNYLVIVGRSIPNSTKFIFDPQMPIMLAN
jgi:hypothetical protein